MDINVTVADSGTAISVTVDPRQAHIGKDDEKITWILNDGGTGWRWSTEPAGIVMGAPTAGFVQWAGSTPQAGTVPNTYVVEGAANMSTQVTLNKYTINLVKGDGSTLRFDPDIANDPQG